MADKTPSNRGGAREGAGRPALRGPQSPVATRLTPEEIQLLDGWAADHGCNRSTALQEAVRALVGLTASSSA